MSHLEPMTRLSLAPPEQLEEQARLRRALLERLLSLGRNAASPEGLVSALAAHAPALLELGLHDEAARLTALSRAVLGDVARFTSEAASIEARLTEPAR